MTEIDIFSGEDDVLEGSYELDREMRNKYVECITYLSVLQEQGAISFEYSPVDIAYATHSIYVTWKAHKGFVEVKRETIRKIAKLFDNMDSFAFADDTWNEWQFTCVIYKEV